MCYHFFKTKKGYKTSKVLGKRIKLIYRFKKTIFLAHLANAHIHTHVPATLASQNKVNKSCSWMCGGHQRSHSSPSALSAQRLGEGGLGLIGGAKLESAITLVFRAATLLHSIPSRRVAPCLDSECQAQNYLHPQNWAVQPLSTIFTLFFFFYIFFYIFYKFSTFQYSHSKSWAWVSTVKLYIPKNTHWVGTNGVKIYNPVNRTHFFKRHIDFCWPLNKFVTKFDQNLNASNNIYL